MQVPGLPTGTVTFLLTDIESSTRLWQEHPDGMRLALAGHDQLLAEIISEYGGRVVKSTGDGVFAVFDRAHLAVEAAVSAQKGLQQELITEVGRLGVRMAVHTGEAEERQGDYFGTAPNRAARLLGAGHGGQVLVSGATREVLSDAAFEFLDLGEHRLRDLARAVHVYQLRHPDLPTDFPPLVSLDAHPHNLPVQLTSFVGRNREVSEVARILTETRLVTLTGVGGAGKTRLSLQVAAELLVSCVDGVWIVELASISDPTLVVGQAAETFGVRAMKTGSGRVLIDVLVDYLTDKELLMVLDNCEHVVESSATLVESLLTRCPQLRILATSRELLGVPSEVVYPVPALGLPDPSMVESEESEAVHLFADRAVHVQPGFRLSPENISEVQEITRRLDGLPLAIELAASRSNLLTPEQLLQHLDDQFRFVTSGRRDRGRHSTLETAMDWSYRLLPAAEQSLFRQLAVFTGGWTLPAAQAVCPPPQGDVLDLLGRLVDQSLVDASNVAGMNRYRLLVPVRHYALAKLRAAGEEGPTQERHAGYFVGLAEESDSGLRGHQQDGWARRIDLDHGNILSALEWSLDTAQDEMALRLASSMAWFWWLRGYWKEAQRWFHRVHEGTPDADPVLRARAVYKLAALEVQRGRPVEVMPLLEEVLSVLEEHGTEADVAWVLAQLADGTTEPERGMEIATQSLRRFADIGDSWGAAYIRFILGYFQALSRPQGNTEMREAIDAMSALGDRWTAAWFSFNYGYTLALEGKYDEARQVIERNLELVEGTYDFWIAAHCRSRLGAVATMTGDYREAKRLFENALPVHRKIGDENCTALVNGFLGEVSIGEGRFEAARRQLAVTVAGFREMQNPYGILMGLRRMGWLAAAQGESQRATQLLGAVETLLRALGGSASVHDGERTTEVTQSLKTAASPERFDEWWTAGSEMDMDDAVALALDG
jgi:predicted ATPase/class 3 adenylate cyclase